MVMMVVRPSSFVVGKILALQQAFQIPCTVHNAKDMYFSSLEPVEEQVLGES